MFKNRAFQVKVVKTEPVPSDIVERTEPSTIEPEQIAQTAKDVASHIVKTVVVGYVSARLLTTTCRIIEYSVKAKLR